MEALDDRGQIHRFGKGSRRRTVRVSAATLDLFHELGRGDADDFVFPSPRCEGHLTHHAMGDVCRKCGRAAGFHVHPHQLRHSHDTQARRRGVDVFARKTTHCHASGATTGDDVASNPRDSASHRLG
ncbi:tyrosine-type recombinase/integrase [Synechococcus sp. KORDI-100]|uniref:tyrosine-type recombinase/integrase n=1 Tax=Synechococcus sp. KORDI-100 TaxID=1280380 RepID=UPI0009E0642E